LVQFDAILLAGGASTRLSGRDKARVVIGGRTLLDRAVAAAGDANTVVVVGPHRQIDADVVWTQEDPPGSGPAAAVAAGLALVGGDLVLLLAVDQPLVTRQEVAMLVAAADQRGAVAVDGSGRTQPLLGVYPRSALADAIASIDVQGARVQDVVARLGPVRVPLGDVARDCDTWDDIERFEEAVSVRSI
jgi:molybdopterin-guanine dinucleotide biosynthesis protein A